MDRGKKEVVLKLGGQRTNMGKVLATLLKQKGKNLLSLKKQEDQWIPKDKNCQKFEFQKQGKMTNFQQRMTQRNRYKKHRE